MAKLLSLWNKKEGSVLIYVISLDGHLDLLLSLLFLSLKKKSQLSLRIQSL